MATRKKVTVPDQKITAQDFTDEIKSKISTGDISINDNVQDRILLELRKQNEYLHRMDWKFWVLMQMVKIIGEENGYDFSIEQLENGEEK